MRIALIPAYDPDNTLIKLTEELCALGIDKIIVINDGSKKESQVVFRQIAQYDIVLDHEKNMGKGEAIKTGLRYVKEYMPNVQSIVFLDADGQHKPLDAMRLLERQYQTNADLVLGVRTFEGKIPFRSLFGNTLTKYVFRLCSGVWVSDTQTGLRAISARMIPMLLDVKGERYEYEMNVLLQAAKQKIEMKEVPIATIYHDDNNSCSHFRVLQDSIRIYGNLIAFSGASFVSFLLDYLLFFAFVKLFGLGLVESSALIAANIAARMFSAGFNYYLNSTFVFKQKENRLHSILNYGALAVLILVLNTILLFVLNQFLGVPDKIAKLITELTLFCISFHVQKFIIFKKNAKREAIQI